MILVSKEGQRVLFGQPWKLCRLTWDLWLEMQAWALCCWAHPVPWLHTIRVLPTPGCITSSDLNPECQEIPRPNGPLHVGVSLNLPHSTCPANPVDSTFEVYLGFNRFSLPTSLGQGDDVSYSNRCSGSVRFPTSNHVPVVLNTAARINPLLHQITSKIELQSSILHIPVDSIARALGKIKKLMSYGDGARSC